MPIQEIRVTLFSLSTKACHSNCLPPHSARAAPQHLRDRRAITSLERVIVRDQTLAGVCCDEPFTDVFLLKVQKGKRNLKPVKGSLEITPPVAKGREQVHGVTSCSWLGLQGSSEGAGGCSRQLEALEWSVPPQLSELGEHLSNVRANLCQSKQTFLPAQGERSGLVSSTQGGFVA